MVPGANLVVLQTVVLQLVDGVPGRAVSAPVKIDLRPSKQRLYVCGEEQSTLRKQDQARNDKYDTF